MPRQLQAAPSATETLEGYRDSPYLLSDEAARFLRFNTRALFVKWAKRNRVPVCRRGRTLLYKRAVLEAFIEGKTWTNRHALTATARRLTR
jgi:hypothetical protein